MKRVTMNWPGAAVAVAASIIAPATATSPNTPAIGVVERHGNHPAQHRITIVSAFSCPYCRVLDQQGMGELRDYWTRRGLEIETVQLVLSPTDMATSIAATCGPSQGYGRRTTILFRSQTSVLGNWRSTPQADRDRAAAVPDGGGAVAIARMSGVDQLGPSLGITSAEIGRCMADTARQRMVLRRQRQADARWRITGTPTVLLDGRRIANAWTSIRPVLTEVVK